MDSIKCRCRRGDLGTNTAVITAYPDRLVVRFGNPSMLGGIMSIREETLLFSQHPEIRPVYGVAGWNMAEVTDLLSGLESLTPEKARIA